MTKEERGIKFIEKAILKHGDLYGYDKVEYVDSYTKVKIYCKKCEEYFWQLPFNHLSSHGCLTCGRKLAGMKTRRSFESVVDDSVLTHGNKYRYLNMEYDGGEAFIVMKCKECDTVFKQRSKDHIAGHGCIKCAAANVGIGRRKLQSKFISDAIEEHGDLYGYSKVEYINSTTLVIIICKTHGEYWQRPMDHLEGCGCPKCKTSKNEQRIIRWLDCNNIDYIHEKSFDDCRSPKNRPLKYDFYIPARNLLIEYDGSQHTGTLNMGAYIITPEQSRRIMEYDKIKNEYASRNNIRLLRIPYWDSKNIGTILDAEFGIIH